MLSEIGSKQQTVVTAEIRAPQMSGEMLGHPATRRERQTVPETEIVTESETQIEVSQTGVPNLTAPKAGSVRSDTTSGIQFRPDGKR